VRGWMREQLERMARDDTPFVVARLRRWSIPVWYCAILAANGIATLLLRPFLPRATGVTYNGIDTLPEAWGLAALMAIPLCYALWEPSSGGLVFVLFTAVIRTGDALSPLSLSPFFNYAVLIPVQVLHFFGWSPVSIARWLLGYPPRRGDVRDADDA
jgi:hypothetical protein